MRYPNCLPHVNRMPDVNRTKVRFVLAFAGLKAPRGRLTGAAVLLSNWRRTVRTAISWLVPIAVVVSALACFDS